MWPAELPAKERFDAVFKLIGGAWALLLLTLKVLADRKSAKADHAKWVTQLYEKFYENAELKVVRESIDCGGVDEVRQIVRDQRPEFTDYLNFFEYVAYLRRNGQLTTSEVQSLFGYYLDCLQSNGDIMAYVENTSSHGYELLAELLHNRKN